jgi:catechol 2,3-dioxygenase-like lactoylglutathione lyase family enzyme
MLGAAPLIAMVGVMDRARAKAFYEGVLGLSVKHEDEFAVQFDAAGTILRLTTVHQLTPAAYSVLGWRVPDIRTMARRLHLAGVLFERFGFFTQDEDGIWTAPDGAQVAWFKDPDGNLLSIAQFAD